MRRIGAVAAALFALVGTAYGGAGRTIEETESWRTAIFWLIFIFLSIMIEMLFHNTEHFLEHHKKKGCAHAATPHHRRYAEDIVKSRSDCSVFFRGRRRSISAMHHDCQATTHLARRCNFQRLMPDATAFSCVAAI